MTGAWLDVNGTRPGLQLYAHGADYGSRASNLIIYFVLGEGEGVRLTGEVRVPLPDGGEARDGPVGVARRGGALTKFDSVTFYKYGQSQCIRIPMR